MMNDSLAQPNKSRANTAGDAASVPVVDVRTIVGGGREAIILHAGERYRLRITAKEKLILTK
jgi:hemin uptake protein HemP